MADALPHGRIQLLPIRTQPGEDHPFSPPAGFAGSSDQYLDLMRRRWTRVGWNQQIYETACCFRQAESIHQQIQGPYSAEASRIINAFR